jgi:hypothetical protein
MSSTFRPPTPLKNADLWAEVAAHEFASSRQGSPVNPGTQALYHLRFVGLSVRGADGDRLACHQHDRPELGVVVDFNNQASYIDDRLGALKTEKKAIFRAAAEAQRVADYLPGRRPDYPASTQ